MKYTHEVYVHGDRNGISGIVRDGKPQNAEKKPDSNDEDQQQI